MSEVLAFLEEAGSILCVIINIPCLTFTSSDIVHPRA